VKETNGIPNNNTPKPTLADKEATVRMLVKVHSLLADGLFPGKASVVLNEARGFIERLHMESFKILQADPDYKTEVEKAKDGNQETTGPTPEVPAN